MARGFGASVLVGFDVRPEDEDFLASIIETDTAPSESQQLWRQSLLSGAEDWNSLIQCAASIRQKRAHLRNASLLDCIRHCHDVIAKTETLPWEETDRLIEFAFRQAAARASVWSSPRLTRPVSDSMLPWGDTDRLIERARQLEAAARPERSTSPKVVAARKSPKKRRSFTSHYWSNDPSDEAEARHKHAPVRPVNAFEALARASQECAQPVQHIPEALLGCHVSQNKVLPPSQGSVNPRDQSQSPYFTESSVAEKTRKRRPARGTVSSLPFPPLTAPSFGIAQEKLAHNPFWLMTAITFLIRTPGTKAIPIFYKLKERFPTPEHLADPANEEEMLDMIRHLGLSAVRVQYLQRYAKAFLAHPPRSDVRYKVNNYDRREESRFLDSRSGKDSEDEAPGTSKDDAQSWEIGHMTQGRYAIDSWRIFCRDELLGRAEDWNGKGREPEFQPEWMRVLPTDKELRAYLRWMWMREGWEWDPLTGHRTPLRGELQRAVNQRRVRWNNAGELEIVSDEAIPSSE